MTPTLIVTRPVLQGEGFAADIATRWHGPLTIIQSPLIEIVPIASQVDQLDGAIFTSTNGVGAAEIMELPKGLTAWCVGAKTAEAARKVGFCPITGPGDAEGLVNAIIANAPKGKLVHIRGRHARGDVCTTLVAAGLHCIDVVAYDQQPLQLNEDAKVALSAEYPLIFPLFSPRTATILSKQGPFVAPVHVVALSDAVKDAIAVHLVTDISVAELPESAAMIDATIAVMLALVRHR